MAPHVPAGRKSGASWRGQSSVLAAGEAWGLDGHRGQKPPQPLPLRPDPRSGGATGRIFTWKENVELHGGYIGRDLRVAEMLFIS